MSLLVKGMDMPCACLACDFCNTAVDRPYCQRLMREVPKTTRPDWCPLGEVTTPHGRLIDADAVEKLAEGYQEQADIHSGRARELCGDSDTVSKFTWAHSQAAIYKRVIDDLDTVLSSAPTVIEAEEGKKNRPA